LALAFFLICCLMSACRTTTQELHDETFHCPSFSFSGFYLRER
jgi:hypothetical protein